MQHPRRSRSAILIAALVPLLVGATQPGSAARAEGAAPATAAQGPSEPFPTLDALPFSANHERLDRRGF